MIEVFANSQFVVPLFIFYVIAASAFLIQIYSFQIKPQPAIKSYYFGKGYKDLWSTIENSWEANLETAEEYTKRAKKYWENGGFEIAGSVFFFFAAVSVIIFGTLFFLVLSFFHGLVLLTFFSLIYYSFTILFLIEKSYWLFKGIFSACPACHQKTSIPTYLCPKCGAGHSNLIPGCYGILNRKCLCGTKLPTSFLNGRKNLQAVCPSCERAQEAKEAKPLCIPILGGPSSGKTCFLFSATHGLINSIGKGRGWGFRFLNPSNELHYKSLENQFNTGTTPSKTTQLTPAAFNIFVNSNNWSVEKLLYLYDAAGEAFSQISTLSKHKFYGYLHGFAFIIDPYSIPSIAAQYVEELRRDPGDIRPSTKNPEDVFDAMLITLEGNHGIKPTQRMNMPFAIVINKIDSLDLGESLGESAARRFARPEHKTLGAATDALCADYLQKAGMGNLLRKIEGRFSRYRFFPCVAFQKPSLSKVASYNQATLPLLWILEQIDKDFTIKR